MAQRRDKILNHAALVPVAGNFDQKPRSLDRDVTTIGRARGCDLCLEANEISTLHCIIYRTAEGYRIRDCSSRAGCRLNGESVKNGPLHNADIVNIGPFSFEFREPPALFPKDGTRLDPVKVEHWKESRRRFAQLALKLRQRLGNDVGREKELAQKANLLKEKIRCHDQRLRDLEEAEEELTQERAHLAKEMEAHQQRVQGTEAELALRLADVDEQIHERWQEFQQRCHAEETARAAHASSVASRAACAEQLARQQEELANAQREFSIMKEQWANDQAKSSAAHQEQEAKIASQRTELMRMMGELKKMQDDLRKQAKPDVAALHAELASLRDENQQLRTTLQSQSAASADEDLRAEVELLQEELQRRDTLIQELKELRPAPASNDSAAEAQLLKKLLAEKDRHIEDLTKRTAQTPKNAGDLERYEAELNGFRRQLESDRNALNAEMETLRERNKEMDEAIREMEMEMSKERAELGRERMRLDRMREEVKLDGEKLQRELAVRDSMAPLQKLRDEITGRQPQPSKAEKPLNDRLRTMRNQLTDSST